MYAIENAWKVPLSSGGVFRIDLEESYAEMYRILSGKYIQNKISLRKDSSYIESLINPGATDPVEPETLYNNILKSIKFISDAYYSDVENKLKKISNTHPEDEYMKLNYNQINEISIVPGTEQTVPELHINNDVYLLVAYRDNITYMKGLSLQIKNIVDNFPNIKFRG